MSDDLKPEYVSAVGLMVLTAKGSTSFIQRTLGLGYNAASSLVEQMEDAGILAKPNHVGKREVLVTADRIAALEAQLAATQAGQVTVKPLVWKDHASGLWSIAETSLGQCGVQRHNTQWGYWTAGQSDEDEPYGICESREAAKAAAQADYEARILSAITLSPMPVDASPAADPVVKDVTVAEAARVLLADLALSLDTEAYGKGHPALWVKASDAADAAPTYNDRPTAIQMIRAALRAITEASHE